MPISMKKQSQSIKNRKQENNQKIRKKWKKLNLKNNKDKLMYNVLQPVMITKLISKKLPVMSN